MRNMAAGLLISDTYEPGPQLTILAVLENSNPKNNYVVE
jgi:hypothetical protein